MMPQHVPNTPVCRNCDGFPVVAITTGGHHRDGSRVLLRVVCPACDGHGVRPVSTYLRTLAQIGR
jgi:formate dehydrogenase maturation protein FdhE